MYVHSVKLVNYKSFGDYAENEVIIESGVTAIIGKNESGKSNILEGISRIDLREKFANDLPQSVANRSCSGESDIKYIITLKSSSAEKKQGVVDDTIIAVTKGNYSATGGLLSSYLDTIHPIVTTILDLLGPVSNNPFELRDALLTNYKSYYQELSSSEALDIPRRTAAFAFLLARIEKVTKEKRDVFKQCIETANSKWQELTQGLPLFFFRSSDRHLNHRYKYEDIEKELLGTTAYPNSLLKNLVRVIGISVGDFLTASKTGVDSKQESLRRKISQLINQKINDGFKQFYGAEDIVLDISFNNGTISFGVQSNTGEYLLLAERSNGLRWYLDTYIDALSNDIVGKNVVYLLDEPGVSLHVNAQKELLRLFEDLVSKGNQVVYTTHSPYMLDLHTEGFHRIRAVVKSNDGFSYVYKTAYDARIAPESQQDTLTPIVHALGMNLYDSLGPATGKINIVTEGMSDYIFINTFAKMFGVDSKRYAIIPSVGAPNCVNICMILHGWGCPYKAVFDYDLTGAESGGEYMREKMLLEYGKDYCYVAEVSEEEIAAKTYKTAAFMIEDAVGRAEISRFLQETGTATSLGKPLTAKVMCTAIENGTFIVSPECLERMKRLINWILTKTP